MLKEFNGWWTDLTSAIKFALDVPETLKPRDVIIIIFFFLIYEKQKSLEINYPIVSSKCFANFQFKYTRDI